MTDAIPTSAYDPEERFVPDGDADPAFWRDLSKTTQVSDPAEDDDHIELGGES